jgi:hypothetical protein
MTELCALDEDDFKFLLFQVLFPFCFSPHLHARRKCCMRGENVVKCYPVPKPVQTRAACAASKRARSESPAHEQHPKFFAVVARACEVHVAVLQHAADTHSHLAVRDWLCIDWKFIGDTLKPRPPPAIASDSSVMSQFSCLGADKPLRTHFALHFLQLACVSGYTLGQGATGGSGGEGIFVEVEWEGETVSEHVAAETKVTHLQHRLVALQKGPVSLSTVAHITLQHRSNAWSSLPPLRVSVYALRANASGSVQGIHHHYHKHFQNIRPSGSHSYHHAGKAAKGTSVFEKLWSGTMPLHRLVSARLSSQGGREEKVYLESTSDTSAPIGPVALSLTATLTRKIWRSSQWHRVLGLVQNRDNSSFFARQRQAFVHALSSNCTTILLAVEDKRQKLGILNRWKDQDPSKGGEELPRTPGGKFLSSPTPKATKATIARDRIASPRFRGTLNKMAREEDSAIQQIRQTITLEKMDKILAKMEKVDALFQAVESMRSETSELRQALEHYTPRPGEQAGMPAHLKSSLEAPQSLRHASLLEGTGARRSMRDWVDISSTLSVRLGCLLLDRVAPAVADMGSTLSVRKARGKADLRRQPCVCGGTRWSSKQHPRLRPPPKRKRLPFTRAAPGPPRKGASPALCKAVS